jgi:hypothetical protein
MVKGMARGLDFFAKQDSGAGLMIAILMIVAVVTWFRTSRSKVSTSAEKL